MGMVPRLVTAANRVEAAIGPPGSAPCNTKKPEQNWLRRKNRLCALRGSANNRLLFELRAILEKDHLGDEGKGQLAGVGALAVDGVLGFVVAQNVPFPSLLDRLTWSNGFGVLDAEPKQLSAEG